MTLALTLPPTPPALGDPEDVFDARAIDNIAWFQTIIPELNAFIADLNAAGIPVGGFAPGQFPGTTTNDNAAAGNIGEYATNAASAVSLPTATDTNIASLTLGPGDWEVWAGFSYAPSGVSSVSLMAAAISTTSASRAGAPADGTMLAEGALGTTFGCAAFVGKIRITVAAASTQTVYLVGRVDHSGGTVTGAGRISARRAR